MVPETAYLLAKHLRNRLKEITVPLRAGRREDIPSVLETSRAWEELTTKYPQRLQDDSLCGWGELVT